VLFQVYYIIYLLIQLSGAGPTPTKYSSLAKSTATANQILNHLVLWQYSFVSLDLTSNTRSTRSAAPNSSDCPFTWEKDIDANRQPSTLLKAKLGPCPSSNTACATNCHAVTYGHRVLKYKCSRVWTWEKVNLPVAFVRV